MLHCDIQSQPRTKPCEITRAFCRGPCCDGRNTEPIDRRCSCSQPRLRCRPLPPTPPAYPHGRRTCWTREVLRRGCWPGSARRALPFRERQARAALRADLHTPAAAAASPLPPSIPLQFRGRACARTHHCLFLGFRIRKRALGFRKRAFCPFPRKTCAQAMQCRTSHPSSMGMCRAARLLSLRGGGALDITTTCDQTQMGECVGAYACSVCACTI